MDHRYCVLKNCVLTKTDRMKRITDPSKSQLTVSGSSGKKSDISVMYVRTVFQS
jgi:hypothetical protein